jgi:DNA-binding protein HU-beta
VDLFIAELKTSLEGGDNNNVLKFGSFIIKTRAEKTVINISIPL